MKLFLFGLAVVDAATKVKCPKLDCSENAEAYLNTGECYKIDENKQENTIYAKECYDNSLITPIGTPAVCPFNIESGKYAWINEQIDYASPATEPAPNLRKSQYKDKMLVAECRNASSYEQDLLPGRECEYSFSCLSARCKERACIGRSKFDFCHKDTDCDAGYYCRTQDAWPFASQCIKQRDQFEQCTNDFQCKNNMFCWYANQEKKQSGSKTCLEIYSQDDGSTFGWHALNPNAPTLEDYTNNGKYCSSGLAYPVSDHEARCTSFWKNEFDGKMLTDTDLNDANILKYQAPCDPSDQAKKCKLWFKIHDDDKKSPYRNVAQRNYVQNQCKCALDGKIDSGYCSSMLGTELYRNAAAAMSHMMSESTCHSRDRHNSRAQKDQNCGIGRYSDEFRFAVDQMFNMTYWPYIQKEDTYKCVRRFFTNSFDNLILQKGIRLATALTTLGALVAISSI